MLRSGYEIHMGDLGQKSARFSLTGRKIVAIRKYSHGAPRNQQYCRWDNQTGQNHYTRYEPLTSQQLKRVCESVSCVVVIFLSCQVVIGTVDLGPIHP